MDLKEFVKDIIVQLNEAVDEARQLTPRDIYFSEKGNARTVEFDIAVSVEDADKKSGKAGIKVLQYVDGGGEISKEFKNSTVSRVSFGLTIEVRTKEEENSPGNQVLNGPARI